MKGKKGLIMGVANERSIAWGISQKLADAGAELAFTYQGEALKKRVVPLAQSANSNITLPCDVTDMASIDKTFEEINRIPKIDTSQTETIYKNEICLKIKNCDIESISKYLIKKGNEKDFPSLSKMK